MSPSVAPPEPHDMLEDPGHSRQWVLRRIQKMLTTDLAVHAALRGLAAGAGASHTSALDSLADRAERRAGLLRDEIEREGGAPYSSVGLARTAARLGGRVAGRLGAWLWRRPLLRLQEHVVGELDALAAFARGAPGVDPGLAVRLAPLAAEAKTDLDRLRAGV